MSLALIIEKHILGNVQETLKMQFMKPFFQSKEGVNLYKNTMTTPIYAKSVASAAVEQGGAATTGISGDMFCLTSIQECHLLQLISS